MKAAKTHPLATSSAKPATRARPSQDPAVSPWPDEPEKVAGMPRRNRTFTAPGDPGVITPEDDYLETSNLDPHRD